METAALLIIVFAVLIIVSIKLPPNDPNDDDIIF